MHTIGDAKKALGLATTNQVRNRIEAAKDVLSPDLRRGPNNQILLTDAGLDTLRRLQALCDTGLRLAEASDVLRNSLSRKDDMASRETTRLARNITKPDRGADQPSSRASDVAGTLAVLGAQVQFLRDRVASLERDVTTRRDPRAPRAWWEALKEEVDGA